MKLKSLLFGSAAAIVTVGGAQAADLPIVEPVDYVRICDDFAGTGFFYIPGTDVCLKVGGRVRVDVNVRDIDQDPADFLEDFDDDGDIDAADRARAEFEAELAERDTDVYSTLARGYVDVEAVADTDIGVVRAYVNLYGNVNTGGVTEGNDDGNFGGTRDGSFVMDQAWVTIGNDFGTFTAGHVSSFFDFFGGYTINGVNDPTANQTLLGFTGELAGFSASISLEDPRSGGRLATTGFDQDFDSMDPGPDGVFGTADDGADPDTIFLGDGIYGGARVPDVVGNVRFDVGPFAAQIMGALRQIRTNSGAALAFGVDATGDDIFDNDATEYGYAVGAGAEFGFFGLEAAVQGAYSEGAIAYAVGGVPLDATDAIAGGSGLGALLGVAPDSIEKTEAYQINAGLSGAFGMLRPAMTFYYGDVDHAGEILDFSYYTIEGDIGVAPASGLYIGVGAFYTDVDADEESVVLITDPIPGLGGASGGIGGINEDDDEYGVKFRVQYTF